MITEFLGSGSKSIEFASETIPTAGTLVWVFNDVSVYDFIDGLEGTETQASIEYLLSDGTVADTATLTFGTPVSNAGFDVIKVTISNTQGAPLVMAGSVRVYNPTTADGGNWDRTTGTPNYLTPNIPADDVGATGSRIKKGWFTDLEITSLPTVNGTTLVPGGYTSLTATTDFATTAASTSTITMVTDQTSNIVPGMPIKFTLSSTVYYAICTAIAANLLTIAGAPLTTTASALTALSYGPTEKVSTMMFSINGQFADAASGTLLQSDLLTNVKWTKGLSYCVMISHIVETDDTGANQPAVNVDINSAAVGTSNTNEGKDVAETWTDTVIDINNSNYDINYGETIEISTDAGGSNNNAVDLTVIITFVMP